MFFIYDNIVLYFLNLFDIFMFVFSKTGISYEIFRFIIVVLSYMLVFVTVKKTLKKMNCNSDICFFVFFSYFLFCSIFYYMFRVLEFGACILSVGVYCLYSLKKENRIVTCSCFLFDSLYVFYLFWIDVIFFLCWQIDES